MSKLIWDMSKLIWDMSKSTHVPAYISVFQFYITHISESLLK